MTNSKPSIHHKNAIVFPHVNIKTAVLGMELRADPFENKLALIFELGKIEQKERIRKWKAFEKNLKRY